MAGEKCQQEEREKGSTEWDVPPSTQVFHLGLIGFE
jgi:hypothetical protein